jgi:hypothetical protein
VIYCELLAFRKLQLAKAFYYLSAIRLIGAFFASCQFPAALFVYKYKLASYQG